MKKIIALVLLCNTAQAQLRHSITLERTGAFFWDSKADGAPFAFDNESSWYMPPTSLNYLVMKGKWGLSVGVNHYKHLYKDGAFPLSIPNITHYDLYSRQYTAGYINVVRQIVGNKRAEILASAGFTQYFESSSMLGYVFNNEETVIDQGFGDVNRPGINLGVVARCLVWKGFTLQAIAAHSKVFGATDFSNISNVRFGLGHTFGGGMNRSPRCQPVP